MSRDTLHTQLRHGVDALGLTLSEGVLACLLDYLALLADWNTRFNLTAVRDPAAMVTRHLLDSLAVLPHVHGARLADLGSGAGLPGIPLAVALPECRVTLVDSNGKKVRFMRTAVQELGLANVEVVQARVESMQGQFESITARAFASLAVMLQWGGHLLAPNGRWLALKGRYPEAELESMPIPFRLVEALRLNIPGLDAERHLLVIRKQDTLDS